MHKYVLLTNDITCECIVEIIGANNTIWSREREREREGDSAIDSYEMDY